MKRLIILFSIAAGAVAQTNVYSVFREESPTGAATALTIQQPASPTKNATILGAYIYCSAACTATLEHTGTPATNTEVTPDPNTPGSPAATIRAFRSSDVGSGTTKNKYAIVAGGYVLLEFNGTQLTRTAAANYTIRIAGMTGTVYLLWMWREE